MKRIYAFSLSGLLALSAFAQTKTLTKTQYRDKTLAMILGSIGGALTGYEYLNVHNTPNGFYQPGATLKMPKEPILGMPDDWFILLNGTLGGTNKDEHNYASWFRGGKMYSDDDQHIDFFNQWLLNQYGLSISYQDIKHEWMAKQVSDFGGGQGAIEVMRDKDLMAPQCGHRDHGNSGHWLPECYIEHEMMGAAFPGMPNKSAEFTAKFSHMTGEGEVVTWGYYWATAHSLAFFETDVRTVVQKALGTLPANCRPRQMYDICVALHKKYPNDWRAAVKELWKDHWSAPFAVGYDKVMMLGDVNNGTGFLSILYGNNDYMNTLKIVSLAGGDGDCTASAVCGMLGIVKGMAGTPADFKNRIYNNGNGRWVNEVAHAFSIKKDFKIEWTYDEIVDMFQQNAEASIRAYGGVVTADGYTIQTQNGTTTQVPTTNWDFEKGTLDGWKTWTAGGTSSLWAEKQCNDNTEACFAGSGKYKGTVLTNRNTSEAKLYQTITGLKSGATYKLEGRTNTASGHEVRFYADNYGGPYKFASTNGKGSPFLYQYLYVTLGATNTSLDVGMHVPATGSGWSSFDDLIIYEVPNPSKAVRYEAEKAKLNDAKITTSPSASGGTYVGWINNANSSSVEFQNVMADYDGEHIARISFANGDAYCTQKVYVNGQYVGLIEHGDTGPWAQFSANVTDAYVKLKKGANTIKLVANTNFAEIDFIDLLSPYGSEGKPTADVIDGEVYRIIAKHSNKALTVGGNIANGSPLVQSTYTRAANQHFKISNAKGVYSIMPVNSTQAVEIGGCGTNNEDKASLWGNWDGDCQQWAIVPLNNGHVKIMNNKSGKVLDVAGGSKNDGATVFQYDFLNGENQQWRFELASAPVIITGTSNSELETLNYSVYPNPTKDKLHFDTQTVPSKIEIFNHVGQLQLSVTESNTVDIVHLSVGVYLAKVHVGQQAKIVKVVKE